MMRILLILTALALAGCDADVSIDTPPQLVVEGWIESGWPPKVILTRSFTVNAGIKYKKDDLQSSIARGARVYVSDGEDSVRLSGKWDFDYFPPYVYTTGRMIGEEGKTYRLTVDYDGFHAEAATTIPSAPDSVRFRASAVDADTAACQISVAFKNNPDEGCGYVCFLNSDVASQQLYASYLGVVDGANMSADAEVPMFRPHHSGEKNYSLYYSSLDTVHAKISSVDEASFAFWSDFQTVGSLSQIMFFSANHSLRSNVAGALGYWCGMGSVSDWFIVRERLE